MPRGPRDERALDHRTGGVVRDTPAKQTDGVSRNSPVAGGIPGIQGAVQSFNPDISINGDYRS
jgi:hypothetical protein